MIKEIIERLSAESPDFFKKIRKIALFASLIITAILGLSAFIDFPEKLTAVLTYILTLSGTIYGFSHLPVKDNEVK
jgi:hypothetical protein